MGEGMRDRQDGRTPLRARRAHASRRLPVAGVLAALVVSALMLLATATASAFSAHGSVEQVYVTGLEANAQMSLLGPKGETVATQNADALGGLLFRHVTPAKKYHVRPTSTSEESGPLTVRTQRPKPWGKSFIKQSIPSSGYGYLTTRDGTQL